MATRGPKYTQQEDEIIARCYPEGGPPAVVKEFKRLGLSARSEGAMDAVTAAETCLASVKRELALCEESLADLRRLVKQAAGA